MTEETTPERRTALRNVYAFLLRRHYARLSRDTQQPSPTSITPQTVETQSPELNTEIVDETTA
jgi:hypothetical protein